MLQSQTVKQPEGNHIAPKLGMADPIAQYQQYFMT
jgi:hypothetical protein